MALYAGDNKMMDETGKIHLRGNSTSEFPKRPFSLKFDHPISLCGMREAKSWVLLANYFDKTMLRNALAFKMSEDSRLDWTPTSQFVELYYNDEPKGVYQLCEKVQVCSSRLHLSPNDWLIEIDGRVDLDNDIYFYTPHMPVAWRIEWPKIPQVDSIHQFVLSAEETLFGDNLSKHDNGWRLYLDEESWIDWYLINEITKNFDANFNSSCFLHSREGAKIVMGPVWDFDISTGNINSLGDERYPYGWHIRKTNWYARLFEDAAFREMVKKRFGYFYERRSKYSQFLRSNAARLCPYANENDSIWHTFGVKVGPNPIAYGSYDEEVEALVLWLEQRFEWMNENL